MWTEFFKKTDNVLLGEDIFNSFILMPYENLNDNEFFRHYYFVRNSFVKMSNKVFLKVEPLSMVSNLKENLLQTFRRHFGDTESLYEPSCKD